MTEREFLKSVPLFARLGEASLDAILRLTRRKRFRKDEVVFHEKEVGEKGREPDPGDPAATSLRCPRPGLRRAAAA